MRALKSVRCALDERADWEPLWRGYLDFYKTIGAAADLRHHLGAAARSRMSRCGFLAHTSTASFCGIVHYLYHRSCWTVGDYCYLQDLFVAQDARKLGLGRALIEAVYREAKAAGASRVHWLTHETNATARALYDTLADRPGFIQYRKVF